MSVKSTHRQQAVLELAILKIKNGMTMAFEESFKEARGIIQNAKGYQSHSLKKCHEDAHKYLLLVYWDTVDDHEIVFRQSEAYQEWKALLHHYYDPFPNVEHYLCLSSKE